MPFAEACPYLIGMAAAADPLAAALDSVRDPVSGKGLIAARRAAAPRLSEGVVTVILDVTSIGADQRAALEAQIRTALETVDGVAEVRVAMTSEKSARRIIAVASGKGGVGKSTLAANLAIALARRGMKVGIVDADIYGPSLPRLLGAEDRRPTATDDKRLVPIDTAFGVAMLSMGQLVSPDQAIAWRGPMVGKALGQLIDADWGEVDTLVLDLPPGTGDVQITMLQKYRPAGALIISTPQDLALIDAARAIGLFNQVGVPIIGVIENMAGYQCPHCGENSDPFGQGGAEAAAARMGHDFLGRIPLDIALRESSDAGTPPAAGESAGRDVFANIAAKVAEWLNR